MSDIDIALDCREIEMKKYLLSVLLLLNGCTMEYSSQVVKTKLARIGASEDMRFSRTADWVLSANSRIAVAGLSETDKQKYPRAAYELDLAVLEIFQKYFHFTTWANSAVPQHIDTQLATSHVGNKIRQNAAIDYLVSAAIVDIENQLNSSAELYEGKSLHKDKHYGRDKVELSLLIFDAKSSELLDTIRIQGQSSFFADSDSQALDLIRSTIDRAVLALAGGSTTRSLN